MTYLELLKKEIALSCLQDGPRVVQLWIHSVEPSGEHRYGNRNNNSKVVLLTTVPHETKSNLYGQSYFPYTCISKPNNLCIFQEAKLCGINRTVHAGEIGTYAAVNDVSRKNTVNSR